MRRSAIEAGLHWAADRPEILRMLGHEGIRALREAQFTRESFQALRRAGFQEQDAARIAVGIARHANQHGLDANEIARRVAETRSIFGGGNPQVEQEWRDRMTRFFANPNDTETRQDMDRALNEIETRGTPAQREHVDRLRPLLRLERQATAELQAETDTERAAREAREAERARAEERARQEAAESARAEEARAREAAEQARLEAERRRLAALEGEDVPADTPTPAVREGPPLATGQQQAEARPPSRLTVAPT
jgi:hypothetical protein